jgi:23S rRNA pseudoU1915 N3-methylase RlmH
VKIKVAWIGKTKEAAIQSLTDEYLKRLLRYADVEGVGLKDEAAILKLSARDARYRHTLVLLDGRTGAVRWTRDAGLFKKQGLESGSRVHV